MSLLDQRCFHHDGREAVAQCPSCKLFFCRECVTEHAGRMICVTCVNALTRDAGKSERAARARWTVTALAGLLIAWLVFYYLGLALARIPSKFHGDSEQSRASPPSSRAAIAGMRPVGQDGILRPVGNRLFSRAPRDWRRLTTVARLTKPPHIPESYWSRCWWGGRFRLPSEPRPNGAIPA